MSATSQRKLGSYEGLQFLITIRLLLSLTDRIRAKQSRGNPVIQDTSNPLQTPVRHKTHMKLKQSFLQDTTPRDLVCLPFISESR